jgi:hypothetical protein
VPSGATTPGRWVDAGDLRIGDEVLLRDGRVPPVTMCRQYHFTGYVYNLEVEELHCYAVGQNSALVHNNNMGDAGTSTVSRSPVRRITLGTDRPINQVIQQLREVSRQILSHRREIRATDDMKRTIELDCNLELVFLPLRRKLVRELRRRLLGI